MSNFDRRMFEMQARIMKALAHPIRLFIVNELSNSEKCVCELTKMVGVKMPTVSRHLSILKNAGIIEEEKRGVQIFYRLAAPCVLNFFKCLTEVKKEALRNEGDFIDKCK